MIVVAVWINPFTFRNGDTAMLLQDTESENELHDKKETSFTVEMKHSSSVPSVPQDTNDWCKLNFHFIFLLQCHR